MIRWLERLWPFSFARHRPGGPGEAPAKEVDEHVVVAETGGDRSPAVGPKMGAPAHYGVAPAEALPAAGEARPQGAPQAGRASEQASQPQPEVRKANYVQREKGDVSDKVAWGSGVGLIFAGVLNTVEQYTGIPMPEGLDAYLVAAVGGVVGYFKKDRA